jgi:FAD dependent oxidoreductase
MHRIGSSAITPAKRGGECPIESEIGLGETRTPTSFRTSAPKTDASAVPPRGLFPRSNVSLFPVSYCSLRSEIFLIERSAAKGFIAIMRRRQFLEHCGYGLTSLLTAWAGAAHARAAALAEREICADVVIVGGGLGGCAAALAALRSGCTVILTEPTDWIGGQLTSQAVPPDEHPWIEQFGCSSSYRALREGIRAYYHHHYPMTAKARASRYVNPGNGNVSKLCHEPKVALAVLADLLAPYCSSRRLQVLLEHDPIRANVDGDRIRAVMVRDRNTSRERELIAPYFLDATELGDLLSLAGVEFVTGAEGQDQTGEPHAPARAQPDNQQGITCCFAVDFLDGQDHTIDRPAEYNFWKEYVPTVKPAWPGRLLDMNFADPVTLKPVSRGFDPRGAGAGLWVYRRIIDPQNFQPGAYPGSSGTTLVNWPQNDYWLGHLIGRQVTSADAERHVARAKQLSLSLLYWLQTECFRPDGKTGWRGLRLRPDLVGTEDGLAKAPYIRESRRIQAEFTVVEQHVGTDSRRKQLKAQDVQAELFADSVGVGSYRIDLHPSTGSDNYIDISSLPFQVPLGALIPRRMENLLPACKNLGTTHITNGCFRLHPVEWAIGEAAGALAAYCIEHKESPRAVRNSAKRLSAFQARLVAQGVEIAWPRVSPR